MFNLIPVIGEVNDLRSDYPYGIVTDPSVTGFGACDYKIDPVARIAEPPVSVRGRIARASLYMADEYPTHLQFSDAQRQMFTEWNASYPATADECGELQTVAKLQGNTNPYVTASCRAEGFYK